MNIIESEEKEKLVIRLIQVKTAERKPWKQLSKEKRQDLVEEHVKEAGKQLLKDIKTVMDMIPDISIQDFNQYIDLQCYVALPGESSMDWKRDRSNVDKILFKGSWSKKVTNYERW